MTTMTALAAAPHRSRVRDETLMPLHRAVLAREELVQLLNSLPYLALVIDASRRIIFANQALLDTFGLDNLTEVLGQRPGELLACLHADLHTDGCGAAEGCRHCQTALAVAECLAGGKRTVCEARVSTRSGERLTAYDLRVTATPLELSRETLAMVYLEDISAVKRREHLENIFLHDLLNSISGLQMLAEVPAALRTPQWNGTFMRQVDLLADEVRAHRLLARAEHGDLAVDISCIPAVTLLEEALAGLRPLAARRGVSMEVALPDEPAYLATDLQVARRVILNTVKNAVEAAADGECVRIDVQAEELAVIISVWNPQPLSDEVRHQLFQRSFSTKGAGRGLGTYSMRLLLEDYLDGRVDYATGPLGTTFRLTFPSVQRYLGKVC
jgi:signal transduction histidine kinase